MITLSKSGGTVTFTFDDNSTYLQNGTIEVPLNSLSLIIDESGMATFRKSASNDIFVSALYSEFGMTKEELEAWYKENLVGSAGIDSGAVQTQIDESISGKADTSALTVYFDDVEYDSSAKTINFYNDGVLKDSIDASDFVIDGMIDDVRIETISGASYLVIDFNTASGKEDIQIPLSDIFNPDNYYDKTAIDGIVSGLNEDIAAAVSGKVNTSSVVSSVTSASTDSEIPTAKAVFDAIPTGGGATYSAGTGINIDSANTITATYRGYLSFDNPQSTLSEYSGEFYIKAPWIDCHGQETGNCNIYTAEYSEDYRYSFSFNPTTKQYTVTECPQDKENDWQNYFTITFDEGLKLFKVTTLQEVASINDNGCVRFFRIGSGYNDYSWKYSGTTEQAFDGIADNFNNYFKSAYFGATSNSLEMRLFTGTKESFSSIKLEEMDGSNNTLKPNMIVGTGVSGWTEVQMNGCSLDGEVGAPIFRMSGDTSDLSNFDKNSFNTQWYLEIENYGSANDSVYWNGADFVLNSPWFGDDGNLGTATVTYDDVHNTLTIAYPLTVSPYGYDMKVKLNNFYSINCQFGTNITKFEYFSEVMQPLKPYIKETRAEVANKVPTSAITSAVTSASTDSEIPTAKAVFDAIPTGGGATYSAGTNISIDTANTISCTLNITNGSGVQSLNLGGQTDSKAEGAFAVAEGVGVSASSIASHAEGFETLASGLASHAEGGSTKAINDYEHASGQFNVSSSASTTFGDSGNTLFSVGNGTADNERHNAFEIRQNGDIYLSSGGTDIKLQDHLGGGGGLDSDTERLLSTALVDLNERKIDASEVKSNYQQKGDYATKSELAAKANASDVMTLEKAKENELVTAAALNSINERLIALEAAVQALQALHINE